ncbi:hypothetical protein [Actinomadura sp. KC216]|nr:hypothetical protein [Actinomadura sp. KC216]
MGNGGLGMSIRQVRPLPFINGGKVVRKMTKIKIRKLDKLETTGDRKNNT